MALRDFAETNPLFRKACQLASTPESPCKPTRRQASRWHQARGRAYAQRQAAQAALGNQPKEADHANP